MTVIYSPKLEITESFTNNTDVKNPVLVLGAGLRLTLVIARSLHRQGIPVIVAPTTIGEPPIKSRAIKKHAPLPDFKHKPNDFIQELTILIRTEGIDMIMPTGDGAIAAVAQHYETLKKLVHVGSPPPHVTERVLDKRLTLAAAQKCGIPIAASRTVEDITKINTVIEGLRFPLIAKPAIRKGANTYRIRYFMTVDDFSATIAKDAKWLQGGLLQEYIPGIGKGVGVLMHEGSPVTLFQHRRLKEYPYTGGVSVMAETEAVDPVLGNLAVKLLQEIEWQGIAMVEYRFNPENNTFVLMEINGRYWGSLFLPIQAGIDFPFYEWQLAHGEQPNIPETYPIGKKARWLAGDIMRLRSILEKTNHNEIQPVSRSKETIKFITDFGFHTCDAVFSWRDPMPAIQEFNEIAGTLLKKDIKRLVSKALPRSLAQQIRIYRSFPSGARSIFAAQQLRRFLRNQAVLFRPNANKIRNILFVCLGNIIRSPTAAIALKNKLSNSEVKNLKIESAGLWEGLAHVEPRPSPEIVVKVASEFELSLTEHRSQFITQDLIDSSDVIFIMDYQNEAMLLSRYPGARPKTFLLGACIERIPTSQWEIADPYGKTEDDVRACLSIINDRVTGLVKILMNKNYSCPK